MPYNYEEEYNPRTANFASGLTGILGGLFGNSGAPYNKAMDQYRQWATVAQNTQNPFYNAGTGAIPNYQNWSQSMQDPSSFINNLMGQYQESPHSRYLQQESMRAGQNAASAGGLMGSTPLMNQLQQNSANISSQDMNNWLQTVLGINNQYGQTQQNLMAMGANSANALTNLFGDMGKQMGEGAYGSEAGNQQDRWNFGGGLSKILSMFL